MKGEKLKVGRRLEGKAGEFEISEEIRRRQMGFSVGKGGFK